MWDTISITDTNTGLGRVSQTYELQTVRDINMEWDTISNTDTDTGEGRVYQTYELQIVRDINMVWDTISITDTDTGVGRVYQTYELQTVRDINTGERYHIHHRHRHRCMKSLSYIRVIDSQGHKHRCGDTISIRHTDTDTGVGRVYKTYQLQTVINLNTCEIPYPSQTQTQV